jgi:hypothetical protein
MLIETDVESGAGISRARLSGELRIPVAVWINRPAPVEERPTKKRIAKFIAAGALAIGFLAGTGTQIAVDSRPIKATTAVAAEVNSDLAGERAH